MSTSNIRKCPVCGKPLSEAEYFKALGLWEEQQRHIQHLVDDKKKSLEQARKDQRKIEAERQKLHQQAVDFKLKQAKLRVQTRKALAEQSRRATEVLKQQRVEMERSMKQRVQVEVKTGITAGIKQQAAQFRRQQADLRKTQNKMTQLEQSLKLSAEKYDQANSEIKRLKEQIEKGTTPQIEGLLEEDNLLAKLRELFPNDTFTHPGKGGDIVQTVVENGAPIGIIVYECKKVKQFDKKHIDQAKEARRQREADFAILVTNAFPSKKQFYFVEKTVFVISPVSLEPITQTLRDSLVKIAALKLSNEAKTKAVQEVYDYLSSHEYSNKVNDVANHLLELGQELKTELSSHRRSWEKRYRIYSTLFNDIGIIDGKLRGLLQSMPGNKTKLLPAPQREFVEIKELN